MFYKRKVSYFLIALMMCGGGLYARASDSTIVGLTSLVGSSTAGLLATAGVANLFTEKTLDSVAIGLSTAGHPDKAYVCKSLSLTLTAKQFTALVLGLVRGGVSIGAIGGLIVYTTGCCD
jgi:nucleoside recognition membrane protein YjiH